MRSLLRQLRDEWPMLLAMLGAGWACWAYYTF